MRIGFDGKRAVQNFTGLGNYSRYIVDILCQFYPENEYVLYAPKKRENKRQTACTQFASNPTAQRLKKYFTISAQGFQCRTPGIPDFPANFPFAQCHPCAEREGLSAFSEKINRFKHVFLFGFTATQHRDSLFTCLGCLSIFFFKASLYSARQEHRKRCPCLFG